MRTVFFGSAGFGLPSLKALHESGARIECVVTQPDRPKGRGLSLGQTVIKEYALAKHLQVFQPERINTGESLGFLKSLKADLFVVIAYGQLLSQELLDMPSLGAVNAHASLLPRYRGAAPINWAIAQGEKETGVSIIRLVRQMDAGPVIAAQAVAIDPDDTCVSLEFKLAQMTPALLQKAVGIIKKGSTAELTEQDPGKVTFAPKLRKEHGLIRWELDAAHIERQIRAFLEWPGAYTFLGERMVKIHSAAVCHAANRPGSRERGIPGEVVEVKKEGITIACGKDALCVGILQPEGKRIMSAAEFLSGRSLKPGTVLRITPRH